MTHPRADDRESEELRQALRKSELDIQSLRSNIGALTEENGTLRQERDSYRNQLEALQAELHATTEEMTAAARFSEEEWRVHCDRVETRCSRLQKALDVCMSAALEYVPHAEEVERRRLWEEEEGTSRRALMAEEAAAAQELPSRDAYHIGIASSLAAETAAVAAVEATMSASAEVQLHRMCRALGCTREELCANFLGKAKGHALGSYCNTSACSRGLYELYLELCQVGFPSDAAITELLKSEWDVDVLVFNAIGRPADFDEYNYAIPPTATAYDFFHRILRHLPGLWSLYVSHLPPLSSPEGRQWLAGAPRTLRLLYFFHSDYTVADLLTLRQRCPGIRSLYLHASRCTSWGPYANIEDMEDRKELVRQVFAEAIFWWD